MSVGRTVTEVDPAFDGTCEWEDCGLYAIWVIRRSPDDGFCGFLCTMHLNNVEEVELS